MYPENLTTTIDWLSISLYINKVKLAIFKSIESSKEV